MIQLKQIKSSKGLKTNDLPVRLDPMEAMFKQEPEMDTAYGVNLPTTTQETSAAASMNMSGLPRQNSFPDMDGPFRHRVPEMIVRRGISDDTHQSPELMVMGRERNFSGTTPSVSVHLTESPSSMPYQQEATISVSREVPFGHLADLHEPPSNTSPIYSRSNSSVNSPPVNTYTHSSESSHDFVSDKSVPMETDASSLPSIPSVLSDGIDTAVSTPPSDNSHSMEASSDNTSSAVSSPTGQKSELEKLDQVISTLEDASRYLDPIKRRVSCFITLDQVWV